VVGPKTTSDPQALLIIGITIIIMMEMAGVMPHRCQFLGVGIKANLFPELTGIGETIGALITTSLLTFYLANTIQN